MYIHEQRNQLLVLPGIENEDLLVYGIRKFKQRLHVVSLSETTSPEGGEWTFIFDDVLRRLVIEKKGASFQLVGALDNRLRDALRSIFVGIEGDSMTGESETGD